MSSLTIFPTKHIDASVFLPFDFISQLIESETITSSAVAIVVILGNDPNPALMLSGISTVVNQTVKQKVIGGVVGTIYAISCSVVTNLGNILIMQGKLAIVDSNSFEV